MSSSLQLFSFSSVQSFMVIYGLPLQSLYLFLELNLLSLILILLSIRPLKDASGFFFVESKFLLFKLLVFVDLSVFHFELGDVVPGFILICFKVQLHNGAIPNWKSFSFPHFLKIIPAQLASNPSLINLWWFLRTLDPPWFFRKNIASPKVKRPLLVVVLFIADLYSCEYFAESGEELILKRVVKFSPAFREGVEEGIEDRLS